MTALVVLNIKRSLEKNHAISERDARILLAHLDAQEKQIEILKIEKAALTIKVKADNAMIAAELNEAAL
jgi:hypothetical protein